MQIDRRQLTALMREGEVQERQSVGVDVVARRAVSKRPHADDRRPQIASRDEQVDVAGRPATGVPVQGLGQSGPLDRERAYPGPVQGSLQPLAHGLEQERLTARAGELLLERADEA